MILKNIAALLCVVCLVEKRSAANPTETISTVVISTEDEDETREWQQKWQNIFNKYDGNKDHLISATELQRLLLSESVGFVTIYQAKDLISVLNRSGKYTLGFEHFKIIKPIMDILSKRKYSEDNDKVDGKNTIPVKVFREELWNKFRVLFKNENEISEIINLIGQNDKDTIEFKKFEEIKEMLPASIELSDLFEAFTVLDKDNNGVISDKELVEIMQRFDKTASKENATEAIRTHDKNRDGVIDFPEFLRIMKIPRDTEKTFVDMFGDSHITREQLKDYVYKINETDLQKEDLELIDPKNTNKISYKDLESYLSKNQ